MSESISVKIAIISDLHCTSQKNTKNITHLHGDLTPYPVNRNPVESIKKTILEENINVDFLFCLGDVTNISDSKGLIEGVNYLKDIKAALNAKEIILVNGNHDMDILNLDSAVNLKKIDLPIFDNPLYWTNHFIIKEYEEIIVFILNTSFHINHADKLNLPPKINDELLQLIEDSLKKTKSKNKIKIALFHHHPIQHSDKDDIRESNDLIDGADKLLEIFKNNDFNLVLHGHKHLPRIKYDDNLVVFCSGSFSSLENVQPFNNKNTFHIIDILRKNHLCKGVVNTWVYTYNEGFNKPDSKTLFPANTGFGFPERDVKDFADQIIRHFNSWYSDTKYEVYLMFKEVLTEFPDISYLTPREQDDFTMYLHDKYGLEIYPSLKNGANHFCKMIIK